MKFTKKNTLILFLSSLAVAGIFTGAFFYLRPYWVAYNFLNNVQKGNFEQAAKSVYFYNDDGVIAKREAISDGVGQKIWANRVQKLKDKGFYLKGFSGLKISRGKGTVKGTVKVTLSEKGKDSVCLETITFSPDGKKIEGIYSEKPLSKLVELALTGNVADIDMTYLTTHLQPGATTRESIKNIIEGRTFLSYVNPETDLRDRYRNGYFFTFKENFNENTADSSWSNLFKNRDLALVLNLEWAPSGILEVMFISYMDRKEQMYRSSFYIGSKDRQRSGSLRVVE